MYYRCMLIAFLTNGMGAFGLRILAGSGLGNIDELQYLALWYLSGAVVAIGAHARGLGCPARREVVIAGAMALCSLGGQLGMALSLSAGLPGFVVFPVVIGGGLLLVVAAGVLMFRECLHSLGYLGIAAGIISLVLLATP